MTGTLGVIGQAKIPPPRNILLSYYYYKRVDIDKLSYCRIIADSGAFSARTLGKTISINQLAMWTRRWEHRLSWVANLDTPNIPETRRNFIRIRDEHGIDSVSTMHAGDPFEEMDWYANQGVDFLGLGGVAGLQMSPAAVFRWIVGVFKYARENHPEMRFHGWGMTREEYLRLPFYSVDSSGWGSAYRYGRMMLRNPVTHKNIGVELDGKGVFKPEVARLLIDHYGIRPSDIAKAGPSNRVMLVKLCALVASVQEQEWRRTFRNHPVTPPKYGRLKGFNMLDGPNQHLALSGCGAGIRERAVFDEMHLNGPHMHLVDGYRPHMEIVNQLAKEGHV
jgi:hypothetical protein